MIKWSPGCNCCETTTLCCGTPLLPNPGDLSAAEWTLSPNVEYVSTGGVDQGLLRATAAGEFELAITHDPYLFDSTTIQYTVCAIVRYEGAYNLPWAQLSVDFGAGGDSPEVFFNIAPGGGYWWAPDNTLIDCASIQPVTQQIWGLTDWIAIQFQFRAKAAENGEVRLRWTRSTQDLTPSVNIGDGNRVREISLAVECPPCGDKLLICSAAGGELPMNNVRAYLEYVEHGEPELGSNVERSAACDYMPDPIGSAPLDLGLGNITFDGGGAGGDVFWFWEDRPATFVNCIQDTINPPSSTTRDVAMVQAYCDEVSATLNYHLAFDLEVDGGPDPPLASAFRMALFQDVNGDYWVPENQLLRLQWAGTLFPDGYALVRLVDESPP